jgi:WD40 repeat protein
MSGFCVMCRAAFFVNHESPPCLLQRFGEVPSCIALHPTGLTVVVGFESALQLMNVLMDSMRLYKEFPIRVSRLHVAWNLHSLRKGFIWFLQNCAEVRFSHGGSMFAAVSNTAISVYGTYTCALVATLRGHADKVVSFVWSRDDRHIVSIGRDGLVVRFAGACTKQDRMRK